MLLLLLHYHETIFLSRKNMALGRYVVGSEIASAVVSADTVVSDVSAVLLPQEAKAKAHIVIDDKIIFFINAPICYKLGVYFSSSGYFGKHLLNIPLSAIFSGYVVQIPIYIPLVSINYNYSLNSCTYEHITTSAYCKYILFYAQKKTTALSCNRLRHSLYCSSLSAYLMR